jgi:hypothetical protein
VRATPQGVPGLDSEAAAQRCPGRGRLGGRYDQWAPLVCDSGRGWNRHGLAATIGVLDQQPTKGSTRNR